MTSRRAWAAWAALVISGAAFVVFCWQPLIGPGGGWSAIKSVPAPVEFVVGDHLAYQAIARNAQEGGALFVEPFTGLGSSIYPSGYYWFLGSLADLTGSSVQQVWNTMGVLIAVGLIAASAAWARWALPGRLAWAAAVAPLAVGTLGWWADGEWMGLFNDSTVAVWAPYVLIAMGGGEAFSMLVLSVALVLLAGAFVSAGRRALVCGALAGAGFGLLFHTHAYVAIFGIFACIAFFVVAEALETRAARWAALWAGAVAAVAVAFSLDLVEMQPTSRLMAVAALGALALVTRRGWIVRSWRLALAVGAPLVLIALPVGVRLARAAGDDEGFFASRQQASAERDLGIPLDALLLYALPVWVLAAVTIIGLARGGVPAVARERVWLAAISAVALVTVLLTLNHLWGVDQEPYRFLPYGSLMIAMIGVPWLWRALADGGTPERVGAAAATALLVATIPTSVAYSRAMAGAEPLDPLPVERAAYRQLAEIVDNEVTLFDSCFWPELVRVTGGPHALTYQPGLADPPAVDVVARVRHVVRAERVLPPLSDLRAAGVAWFATHDRCGGIPTARIRAEFGAPAATFPLPGAERFGFPPGTLYRVYRVAAG